PDEDEAADEEVEPEPKPDPETDRRLAAIQKAEKQAKQAAAAERAAIAKERAEIEEQRKAAAETASKVASFETLLKRAKYDRAGVLRALGVTDDMFSDVAEEFYALSEKGKADPRYKERSERTARERE